MTLHISETPANVQMLPASPIDLAAENAVSNPSPVRTAKCRDMSKLNQLIAAHEQAVKERGTALAQMEIAENLQHDLGGSYTKVRIGAGFGPDAQITVSDCDESRENSIQKIHEYYAKLETGNGFFGDMKKYLSRLATQKAEAVQRVNDACDKLDAAANASGVKIADAEIRRTYKNEDQAICALLAFHATTSVEGMRKGDYLRSTWWYQESKRDGADIMEHHLDALMQGMGCGVAS